MAAEHSTKGSGGLIPQSDLRLVLLGKVGAGKSVFARNILGQENWKDRGMCVKKQGEVSGRTVTVVDTPGWDPMSLKSTSHQIKKEIEKSVTLLPPGPHALLLVVPLREELSGNERKSIQHHMELLSERVWKHTMVLFVSETEKNKYAHSNVIESARGLLEKCEGRYHVVCGPTSKPMQVSEFLQKIDKMVERNSDEVFLPRVYYELFEKKRRTYEDRVEKLKHENMRYENRLKELEQEIDWYKTERMHKEGMRRRKSMERLPSLNADPTLQGDEEQAMSSE
ncbi:GTPase IMAP family member 7-like [Osmerus mordax]|uniref:GTPase IMAP family member 7-like n=1 Tax=Osmerus mordax TaxID=8014 RepID=UPI00350F621E